MLEGRTKSHEMCGERVRTNHLRDWKLREGKGQQERRSCEDFLLTGISDNSIDDINKSCLEEFRSHWLCLENNNHQLWQCRRPERVLNKCVFQKIVRTPSFHQEMNWTKRHMANDSCFEQGLEKTIPDTPKGQTPIHLRDYQTFANRQWVAKS